MATDRTGDKALQEFLSEAQEIVESFNRALLRLDQDRASGRFDPDALNDAFRAVHSLKGLAGLFGVARLSNLSHHLETLLDALRLSKVVLTPAVLDLLFESVDVFHRQLGEAGTKGTPATDSASDELLRRFEGALRSGPPPASPSPWGGYDLDTSFLSVLTEYEEHRLRENIRMGRGLYRVHVAFDLQTIDKGLEDLKRRIKPIGEVISYLPSMGGNDPDKIELDIIIGAGSAREVVDEALGDLDVQVREVPRVGAPEVPPVAPGLSVPRVPTGPVEPVAPPPSPRTTQAPLPVSDDDDRGASLRSVSRTVRVDIRKLDVLLNTVGELGIVRAGIQAVLDELRLDRARPDLSRALHREVRALGRKLDDLQTGILEVRMVPLGQVFEKLSRVVRKISRDAGKEIRFIISGAETELDKLLTEELSDPLMHIIRNCIDHGIEPAVARQKEGKPAAGTIAVSAAQRGNHVVIEVEDDGGGIDGDKLAMRAIERGLLDAGQAQALSRREMLNLMFLPGLSTKDVADELSGRGVGMDVVKTNIARLSGIIDVQSETGQGTRITITLPITLAIIQALVIRAAARTYALPLSSVLESLVVRPADIRTVERREVITLRGQTLPLLRLEDSFRLERAAPPPPKSYIVVVGMAQHRVGLVVDELLGQQDIVIKSLGKALEGVRGIAGATELGNQQTVLVLDVASLVEDSVGPGSGGSAGIAAA